MRRTLLILALCALALVFSAVPVAAQISTQTRVAIYDNSGSGNGTYFQGYSQNAYEDVQWILDNDPDGRFATTVVTDLSASTLANFDVLSLPDNGVPDKWLGDVASWFQAGHVIVCYDSAVCYAAYSGLFWPGYSGDIYLNTLWDYMACPYDGQITTVNYITSNYNLGDILTTMAGGARLYTETLPNDTSIFMMSASGDTCGGTAGPNGGGAGSGKAVSLPATYGAYRDVAGHGRMVILGPWDLPSYGEDCYQLFRNAHAAGAAYDLSFYDEMGLTQLCLNSTGGDFQYRVLKGFYAGTVYNGKVSLFKDSSGILVFTTPSKIPVQLQGVYSFKYNHAAAQLYDKPHQFHSFLKDMNTLDDPPCKGGGPSK